MNGRQVVWTILAVSVAVGCLNANVWAANRLQPNIFVAIADDWGYGHASAYGCAWTKTPAFDRVAREGLQGDGGAQFVPEFDGVLQEALP